VPSAAPAGLGTKLRNAREERALSIEETAWRTRIRPDLIRALEDDEYAALGHEGHIRSHLSSYARFLGMDPGPVVREFASALDEPAPSAIEELERRRKRAHKPPRPKWLAAAVLSGTLLIGGASVGLLGGKTERPAALDIGSRLQPPAVVHDTSRSTDRSIVPAAAAKVTLRIEAHDPTMVSVIVDGTQAFDDELVAGFARTFRARRSIEILVADPSAVELTVNDEKVASSADGTVLRARFGPHGLVD
jgi:cytoskeleton protein RodZ